MKTKKSPPTSIRLSEEASLLRKLLAQRLGVSEAAVLELAIRKLAKEEGIKQENDSKELSTVV